MNTEKSEKLLRLMESVDEELLSEALEEKAPIRRRFRFSYAAIAACAALVLLTGAVFGSQFFGKSPVDAVAAKAEERTSAADTVLQTTVPVSTAVNTSKEAASIAATGPASSEKINRTQNAAAAGTKEVHANQPYEVGTDRPYSEERNGEANQPCLGPDDKPLETTRLVEGEAGKTSIFTENPVNGEIQYSDALENAMEEYGDNALYRVNLEVFRNGTKEDPMDGAGINDAVLAETKRLEILGYTTAYEYYSDGKSTSCRLSLHAAAEQLRTFTVGENCGIRLSLYYEIAS